LEGDAHLAGDGIQEFPALGGVGGRSRGAERVRWSSSSRPGRFPERRASKILPANKAESCMGESAVIVFSRFLIVRAQEVIAAAAWEGDRGKGQTQDAQTDMD